MKDKRLFSVLMVLVVAAVLLSPGCGARRQAARATVVARATPPPPPSVMPVPSPGAAGQVDLAVRQILLRYDGQAARGTFEITVCNWGGEAAGAFQAEIVVNSVRRELDYTLSLGPGGCAGLFDPTGDFGAYGLTSPGRVTVSGTVYPGQADDTPANNTLQQPVEIASLDTGSGSSDPASEPHEIKKQDGSFIGIVPVEYDPLAAWYVADNQGCSEGIASYVGASVSGSITRRAVVSSSQSGSYAGPNEITTYGSETFFQDGVAGLSDSWMQVNAGVCYNAHEMAHLFVYNTPLPSWLNEGFATYMQDSERSGYLGPFPIECRTSGWYGVDFEGVTREVPYQNLTIYDSSIPTIYYYYTGSCFWDYLESTYGHAALQQVIQELMSRRDTVFNACSPERKSAYFIRDIVNPIVGTDISPVTQERFGFGALYTGCEEPGSSEPVAPSSAPAAPSNLRISGWTMNTTKLAWDDNSDNEDGFRVQREGGQTHQTRPDVTTKEVEAPPCKETFNYRVYAFNSVGKSDYSNVVSVEGACPDLAVRNLTIFPNPVQLGQEFVVDFEVFNQGDVRAEPSKAQLEIAGVDWSRLCNVPELFPGASYHCGISFLAAPSEPKKYGVRATADYETAVKESDEGNNTARKVLEVATGASGAPTSPPAPVPGAQISFRVDGDHVNAGQCTTLRWDVEGVQAVYVDGAGVAGHGSKQLCPCQEETHNLDVTLTNGQHEYRSVTVYVSGTCGGGAPPGQTDTTGPEITDVRKSDAPIYTAYPGGCKPTQVTISARVVDPSGVNQVKLRYRISGGDWDTKPMNAVGGDRYEITLPSPVVPTTIEYNVQAKDKPGNTSTSPQGTVKVKQCTQ